MKVKIDFTIEIPEESYANLKEVSGEVETLSEARDFIKGDVEAYIVDYLTSNGVRAEVIRTTY